MNRRKFHGWLSLLAARLAGVKMAEAAEPDPELLDAPMNLVTPTLGGKQFWSDEQFFRDWHIQRNVFTNHYRLLDGAGYRHAWGSYEHCRDRLNEIRRERELPAMSGRAVIVLHGLMRTDGSMRKLADYLHEKGKFSTFNVSYPSTRGNVGDHAAALAKIIARLEGIEEINFVAHSLGNLVVRHYLADHTNEKTGRHPDPRIKRMVMLGAPNNGARIAEVLLANSVAEVTAGKSGQQLAREWEQLADKLATPAFEFGIIAGGLSNERGYNPLLGGDNDLIVTVESTRLAGATDFAVLPVLHAVMMDNPTVQEYVLRFFEHGYFVSREARRPIPTVRS
jgi:pimeloyl-ACP methyl ester carboxylesterase